MSKRTCSIEGCENGGPLSRGWCKSHYDKWYKHGDPLAVRPRNRFKRGHAVFHGPVPRGADSPHWKGDAISVRSIHTRLEAEYGKASTHPCADCGGRARDWAFDEPTGFSSDLSRYRPLCRSCHTLSDGRNRR